MPRATRASDAPGEPPDGSKGIGIAIAGVTVGFFVILPFVLITVLYLFVTIYAIVRALGSGSGEDAAPVVVGFVLLTSVFPMLLGVTIHLIGRSLTPKRSRTSD